MKTKYFLTIIILTIFISLSMFIIAFANYSDCTTLSSKIQSEIEQNTHTMILQFTEPSKLGDKYSWLITSEAGQLAPSLALFHLVAPNSKAFEEDTEIILVQNAIDLDKICEIFHLNYKNRNNILDDNITITIPYYYQNNIENAYPVILNAHYDIIFVLHKPIKCAIRIAKMYIKNTI